jgi:hypothetical protein
LGDSVENKVRVQSVKCQVSSVKCQVSSVKCQVSSVKCQVSSVKFQVSSVKCTNCWSINRIEAVTTDPQIRNKEQQGVGSIISDLPDRLHEKHGFVFHLFPEQ